MFSVRQVFAADDAAAGTPVAGDITPLYMTDHENWSFTGTSVTPVCSTREGTECGLFESRMFLFAGVWYGHD